MNRQMTFPTAAALALALCLTARATDWPQWRGPNRDGAWNETGILQTFPAEGLKFRWRVPVGPGWSSPLVVRGRVYLTDMRLDKPRAWERIRCFKESNGRPVWNYDSELVYPEWAFIPEHGGGPAATPIVEDGRIYSLGRNGQVDCLDARNGQLIWEVPLGRKCLEAGTGNQVWGTTNVTELKFGASIHLTPNDDATFLFTDEGNLIRAQLTPSGYREISRVHLLKPTSVLGPRRFAWIPPVYANRCIFVRNDEELICASLADIQKAQKQNPARTNRINKSEQNMKKELRAIKDDNNNP